MLNFASDNASGIHPEVLAALAEASSGWTTAYGDDPYTARAVQSFREHFGPQIEVYFVFTGTAANVLALAAVTRPYESVLCADSAHVQVDECGAVERFAGCKVLPLPTVHGKIEPESIRRHLQRFGDQHHSQPRIVTITQPTECGTLYTPDEVRAIARLVHSHEMLLHMDGARLSNAAAALGLSLREATAELGVDVLSFGGTKAGLLCGEAVVFFTPPFPRAFSYLRKQALQLASKMRFLAVQLEALLANGLWRRNALHAIAMAQRLASGASKLPGVRLTHPVEANSVFAILPRDRIAAIQARAEFYVWNEELAEVRWMTSFATTAEDVEAFLHHLRELL
jgi:threonine aldolase